MGVPGLCVCMFVFLPSASPLVQINSTKTHLHFFSSLFQSFGLSIHNHPALSTMKTEFSIKNAPSDENELSHSCLYG